MLSHNNDNQPVYVLSCGAESSNTPLSTRHETERPGLDMGSEDWFEVGYGVEWANYDVLHEILDAAKERAQETGEAEVCEIAGQRLAVEPGGAGKGGSYCRWSVRWQGLRLCVQARAVPFNSTPNFRMIASGEACLLAGGGLVPHHLAIEIVHSLGGKVLWNKLSRVDLASDFADADIEVVRQAHFERRFVCRARYVGTHEYGERFTGVSIGRGDISLRIYDKAFEARKSQAVLSVLCRTRWGKPCRRSIRVEFQVRRTALKAFMIDSVEDYFELRSRFIRYLTRDWFRIVAETPDRENRHQDRIDLAQFWVEVCSAFEKWCGPAATPLKRELRRQAVKSRVLVRQAAGCLLRACFELYGGYGDSMEDVVADFDELLSAEVRSSKWMRDASKRLDRWAAIAPSLIDACTEFGPLGEGVLGAH